MIKIQETKFSQDKFDYILLKLHEPNSYSLCRESRVAKCNVRIRIAMSLGCLYPASTRCIKTCQSRSFCLETVLELLFTSEIYSTVRLGMYPERLYSQYDYLKRPLRSLTVSQMFLLPCLFVTKTIKNTLKNPDNFNWSL